MAYLIDRQQALHDSEVVAVLNVNRGGIRSRLLLRDGSLISTLTHPQTLRRSAFWAQLVRGPHGKTSVKD
jgi:hypothetical protein